SVSMKYEFLDPEPTQYDEEFEEYLSSIKTALFFEEWINETDEEALLEKYSIRPGEIYNKLNIADWLCYSAGELARMTQKKELLKEWMKLRIRLKYGAKEELLPLLKLQNIGRIRARKLFNNKIKTIEDIKRVDIITLTQLLGPAVAKDIKQQVGLEVKEIKEEKKKQKQLGQQTLVEKQ
ncbi:MAG: ATP-dependent DNA helicase, partial [Candidatus Woesearchaeota archaeon]